MINSSAQEERRRDFSAPVLISRYFAQFPDERSEKAERFPEPFAACKDGGDYLAVSSRGRERGVLRREPIQYIRTPSSHPLLRKQKEKEETEAKMRLDALARTEARNVSDESLTPLWCTSSTGRSLH